MKKYVIIFIAILILSVVALSLLLSNVTKEKNRLKNNFEIEVKQDLNSQQTITKSELKEYFQEEVETLKEHNIKPSQVENIIKVKYNYVDTLIAHDTLIYIYDTIRKINIADFSIEKNCHTISGSVLENSIEINSVETNDTLLISLFKEKRKCLFNPRKIKAIAISNCKGDTITVLRNLKVKK